MVPPSAITATANVDKPQKRGGCLFWVRLEPQEGRPLIADFMAGPNAPLTKAFISCGWRCLTVDWLLDPSHDLADERRQQSLSQQLEEVIFIAAAIDSTKRRWTPCTSTATLRGVP